MEDIITLEFDDDTTVDCEILGVFDVDGKDYIALVPQDESDDVYLYGYAEPDEESFELLDIEDDDVFEKVSAEFERIMEESAEEDEEEN